jgi:hypothetical protein
LKKYLGFTIVKELMVQVRFKTILSFIFIFLCSTEYSSAVKYYVNDGSLTGDIFCTAVGADGAGRGLAAGSPCATVTYVINNYVLAFNDTVKIDAGTYTESVIVTSADVGANGAPLVFQGAGKTLTIFSNTNFIWDIQAACSFVTIKNMKCTCSINNHVIITSATSTYVKIDNCDLYVNPASSTCGVQLSGDYDEITNCSVTSSGFGVRLFGSSISVLRNVITNTFYSSNAIGIWLNGSNNSFIKQNKCYASAGGEYGLQVVNGGSNCYFHNNYFANYKTGVFCNDGTAIASRFKFNSIYATQFAFYGRPRQWDINSNIFYTTSSNAAEYCFYNVNSPGDDPTTLNRNLYYHPSGATIAQFSATNYVALANLKAGTAYEVNGYEGNPQYSAPATGNLDLTAGSIAIDKTNVPIEGLTVDVRNAARPTAAGTLDIGAYEYGAWVLPIGLLYFNAIQVKDAVLIKWTTASETNNDYFVVERSNDAVNFHGIGVIHGAGNSMQFLNYKLYDREGLNGIIYYRLKQVDLDGAFTYSKIVPLSFEYNSGFSVYPNLISQHSFEVTIHHENRKGPVDILLYTLSGVLIAEEKKLPEPHASEYTFRLDKPLAPGYYILKVSTTKGCNAQKVVVY